MSSVDKHCPEQLAIALEAGLEVESIVLHMNKCLAMNPDDAFMRALVLRVHDLNNLMIAALHSPQLEDTASMRETLEGCQ